MRTLELIRVKTRKRENYVGTETYTEKICDFKAVVSAVTDSYRIALYGVNVSRMYSLTLPYDSQLKNGDNVRMDNEVYKVVSLLPYSDHKVATIEKEGAVNGHKD